MAVALDAKSAAWTASQNAVTSFTNTSFTVGSGSNRALIVALATEVSTTGLPTAPTCNWDSTGTNQSMTLLGSVVRGTAEKIWLFGLVAPTSGAKTLNVAGLNASTDSIIAYIAFTGADQTGGTTTFKNLATQQVSSTTETVTITTVANDGVVAACGSNAGGETVNQTAWMGAAVTTFSHDEYNGCFAIASGASTVMTMTQGSAVGGEIIGVAINQFTAAATAPFVQTDWSHPVRVVRSSYDLSVSLNPNLNTNPIPILNQAGITDGWGVANTMAPQPAYNQNLYTVTVSLALMGQVWC